MILAYVPRPDKVKEDERKKETDCQSDDALLDASDLLSYVKNLPEDDAQKVRERKFRAITDKMFDVYHRKNMDYGNAFGESVKEFGLMAAAIRIGDKYRRIRSLVDKEALVKDESVKDTLLDLANYAIMTLIEMENA